MLDTQESYDRKDVRKDMLMQTNIPTEAQIEKETLRETIVTETDSLTQAGFLSDEITSLLWLRQWYQSGGSDRAQIVRHWNFLKFLVVTGKVQV
jgi:hypothetical protein